MVEVCDKTFVSRRHL